MFTCALVFAVSSIVPTVSAIADTVGCTRQWCSQYIADGHPDKFANCANTMSFLAGRGAEVYTVGLPWSVVSRLNFSQKLFVIVIVRPC